MCRSIDQTLEAVEKLAAVLDTDLIHPKDAPALLSKWSKMKKIAASMEVVIAGKVAASGNWQSEGDNSAAHFVSRTTGESVKGAVDLLRTASALKQLPKTEEAFRSGKLSSSQVSEITTVAAVAPQAEEQLIKVAETDGLVGVRQAAGRVRAAACKDHEEKARRLHETRYLRTWTDSEGAFRLSGQLTPEAGSEVKAVLDAISKDLRKRAPKENPDALSADALLQMARTATGSDGQSVKAEVKIRVDLDALNRGYPTGREICEVQGVGPISVPGLGQFITNAVIRLVGTEGSDVTRVEHAGRYIPPKLRTGVKERHKSCAIRGCNETRDLQIDHTVAVNDKGMTSMGNLRPFCVKHHRKKHGPYLLIEEQTDPVSYRLVKIERASSWEPFKVDKDRSPP